ncbi:MAG: hypothetical protein ACTSUE_23405 [Promethearchaeota archaeon]
MVEEKATWTNLMTLAGKAVLNGLELKVATFQLSNRCPFSCKYCYQDCGPRGRVIPLEIAERISGALERSGWSVRPFIAELVPEIKPFLPLMKRCGVKDMSTSGSPLVDDPSWFTLLGKNGMNSLRILVLPDEKIHRSWTGRHRSRAIEAMNKAIDKGFRVTWNFLLSRTTRRFLKDQVAKAMDVGVHEFNINNFFSYGRAVNMHHEMLTQDELQDVLREYNDLRESIDKETLVLSRTGMIGPNMVDPNSVSARLARKGEYCYAGMGKHVHMIFISVERKVYGCMTHRDPDLQIGDISEDGVLSFNGLNPLEKFDRKNCYVINYLLKKRGAGRR